MSKIDAEWMEKYNALVAFGDDQGHCNATYRHTIDIPGHQKPFKVGSWVVTQRKDKSMGKMDAEKLVLFQRLVDQGKFEWDPLTVSIRSDKTWPLMLQTLVEYCMAQQRKPVTSVPENLQWKNRDGVPVKLGRWMHTQNKLHRNDKLREDRLLLFQSQLIQPGLFTWPITRGSRAYKRPEHQQHQQSQLQTQQHSSSSGHQNHSALHDSTLLLNSNNHLHPTAEVYPATVHRGNIIGSSSSGGNHSAMTAARMMIPPHLQQQHQQQLHQMQFQQQQQQQQQALMNSSMNMNHNRMTQQQQLHHQQQMQLHMNNLQRQHHHQQQHQLQQQQQAHHLQQKQQIGHQQVNNSTGSSGMHQSLIRNDVLSQSSVGNGVTSSPTMSGVLSSGNNSNNSNGSSSGSIRS